jgi:hypothetical protein
VIFSFFFIFLLQNNRKYDFLLPVTTSDEKIMMRIQLPVSVRYLSAISEALCQVLRREAESEGRTAFMRQVGGYIEIYSVILSNTK